LSNDEYLKAALYFPLLCIPMSFYMLFPIANSGIMISRETKYVGISYVTGSTINVITIIALIKYLGVYAIPIALSLSRLFTFEYMRRKSNRRLNLKCPYFILITLIVVSVGSFVVNLFEIKLYIRILSSCICVIFMYYYTKVYGAIRLSSLFKK
jgi:O-antigen/teichoic acid export membrane protein